MKSDHTSFTTHLDTLILELEAGCCRLEVISFVRETAAQVQSGMEILHEDIGYLEVVRQIYRQIEDTGHTTKNEGECFHCVAARLLATKF